VRLPANALGAVAGKALLKYAEVKALVGGATAIQGSAKLSRPYEGWLIRNVEFETFGSGRRSVFQSVRTLAGEEAFADARGHMTGGSAFIYHLAEGTSPALVGEYQALKANDCLHPTLVAIHATALGRPEYEDWGPHGSSMVWSPLSNLWLYRSTSQVVDARDHGIRVCLGADRGPSGSKNLLGELKVADLWNRRPAAEGGLEGAFNDQQLCAMVTANPADAVGWGERLGRVRAGLLADLLVVARRHPDPWRNLIEATEGDLRLVMVGGRPLYGTPGLLGVAGAGDREPIVVGGRRRQIALVDPATPDADMSWRQVVAALEAARRDPVGAERRVAAAADVEPLRLLPDDPGGEPPLELTITDLGEVRIPPLDSLAHDAAFFAELADAPILAGRLAGLAAYYA
jgi:5-methylthioadenosine/S-adenosylhomocysteine deaminase